MLKKTAIFFLIIAGAAAELSFLPNLLPAGAVPDVLLVVVIIWSARHGFDRIWPRAVFSGFIFDMLSFYPVGTNAAIFSAAAWATGFLARRFLTTQKFLAFSATAGFVILGAILNFFGGGIVMEICSYMEKRSVLPFLEVFQLKALSFKVSSDLIFFALVYFPARKIENYLNRSETRIIVR